MLLAIVITVFLLALIPAVMTHWNLGLFRVLPNLEDFKNDSPRPRVSVLIPARNEASSIAAAVNSIVKNESCELDVVILDDQSEDETANIVHSIARDNPQVRLIEGIRLPEGWNGKQHACWRLANEARFDWLLFLDADVRLSEDAIVRMILETERRKCSLLSGFPHQETETLAEKLLIPMMHFLLLGYLPIARMRTSLDIGLAAGCGQLFLTDRESYFQVGGHSAIKASRHDGIMLPRAYRTKQLTTDIFDATDLATCRMYHNCREVVGGLLKNATEGIANQRLIVPFSVLLLSSGVLPLLCWSVTVATNQSWWVIALAVLATIAGYYPRWRNAVRFRQSWIGVVLHPIAILWFTGLQWLAFYRKLTNTPTLWRGRI